MLFGSTVLDVAIGLVFIYLIVSLVCSALNEGVEAILKNRSKDLERGICEMLNGTSPKPAAGGPAPFNIVQAIYDHPLISSLFRGDYATAKQKSELPSYIPAKNFALVLLDMVRSTAAAAAGGAAGNANQAPAPEVTVAELRQAAVKFATVNPKISAALVALIDAAGNDLTRVRLNIENWFDSSMDRVSGWYKRRAQIFIVSFGMAIAALANIDSIAMVRVLSTDGGVREALVAQAGAYAAKTAPPPQQPGATSQPQNQPAAGSPAANPAPAQPAGANTPPQNQPAAGTPQVDADIVKQLRRAGLPIGWDEHNTGSIPSRDDLNGWAMKVIGILLTGLAVSLGAPFWFDLLNRFIVIRSTVKPAEKSGTEKSKQ